MRATTIRKSAITGLGAVIALVTAPATARTAWPNGAKAAVVLTYDDALASQLDNVVPELDAAGFKGTFFLSNTRQQDVDRWRAVAKNGHELANHTIFHACATDFNHDPRNTTAAYSVADMLKEIAQANVLLTAIDGRQTHGFATPCGESKAGGKDYLDALRQSGMVLYTRGVTLTDADLTADVSKADPMHIPARGFADGTTPEQMIDLVKQAEAGGGWAVFLLHGVSGDYLQVSDPAHKALVAWLASHKSEVWVTTLGVALSWAKAHPAAK